MCDIKLLAWYGFTIGIITPETQDSMISKFGAGNEEFEENGEKSLERA